MRGLELRGHEQVYDLAVAGDRVVALIDGDTSHNLPFRAVAETNLNLDHAQHSTVTDDITRVAVTNAAVFMASANEIHVYPGTNIHRSAIDFAATPTELAVLDAEGAQFFAANGTHRGNVRMFAPTAIAVDPIQPGWLVAIDGGIFHLDGPGDVPHLIAPVAEPVRKVRRDRDAVYVQIGETLQAIRGEHVEVLGRLDDSAIYWDDFDAGPDGLELYGRLSASSS